MTDESVDELTREIKQADWSLDLPPDGANAIMRAMRRRERSRRIRTVVAVAVTVASVLGGVTWISISSRPDGAPASHNQSWPSKRTLARLHSFGWVVTRPTASPVVTRREALAQVCGRSSAGGCDKPEVYLLNMRDGYADSANPISRTYWLVALPPAWRPMASCGPATVKHVGPCLSYSVYFEWINATTGSFVEGGSTGVSEKGAPPPPRS